MGVKNKPVMLCPSQSRNICGSGLGAHNGADGACVLLAMMQRWEIAVMTDINVNVKLHMNTACILALHHQCVCTVECRSAGLQSRSGASVIGYCVRALIGPPGHA